MSAFPHLPLFTDAFIADTGHLSAQETGAYLMLLMIAWRTPDCRLPDDDARLARWARVDRRNWLKVKPAVMEFWTLQDGQWSQKRLSKERERVHKFAAASRHNGTQGGRPKSLKDNDPPNPPGSGQGTQQKAPIPIPRPIDTDVLRPSVSGTDATDKVVVPEFRRWLGSLVGAEPVSLAQDHHLLEFLLDDGITRGDIEAGISKALAKGDPQKRFRSWGSFVGWVRGAAQDRLGANVHRLRPDKAAEEAAIKAGIALGEERGMARQAKFEADEAARKERWEKKWPTSKNS